MSLTLWGAAAILAFLGIVFAITYLQAGGAAQRPLARVGRGGLLAVLAAVGISLVGASLAAGLDAFVFAPAMLLVGLLLLLLAALSWLQASQSAAGSRPSMPDAEDRERDDSPDRSDGRS